MTGPGEEEPFADPLGFGNGRAPRIDMHVTGVRPSTSSLLLSSLELSDIQVYEPWIRARLGTASHFCEAVVLRFRT